jgi:hypothetical protein
MPNTDEHRAIFPEGPLILSHASSFPRPVCLTLSASDRRRRGWSTKSASRTRCCCRGRRSTRSLCEGTTRSSGRRPLHEVVIAVAESGQLVAGAPIVSRDVDEGRPILYWPWWRWPASIFVSSGTGTSTSTRRRRVAMGLLSGDELRNIHPFENGNVLSSTGLLCMSIVGHRCLNSKAL